MYQIERGNKKSVYETYDSAKYMHTVLFLFYFVNQQLQNYLIDLYSNEQFMENGEANYFIFCKKPCMSIGFENRCSVKIC